MRSCPALENASTAVYCVSNGVGTQLAVADEGIGFAPGADHADQLLGIKGLYEQAQLVGGELAISSQRDKGTTVQLTIPEKST